MDNRQREMIHILMNQHSKPMVQAAYRRIGDWHLAEDLVQETFLTACWKANQICSHSNPTAWLYQDIEQFDNERAAPQLSTKRLRWMNGMKLEKV